MTRNRNGSMLVEYKLTRENKSLLRTRMRVNLAIKQKGVSGCNFCCIKFKTYDSFRKHTKACFGEQYICPKCRFTHPDRWIFKEHIKTHSIIGFA